MKWWKHRNGTISIIWDLHISLLIGNCIRREAMSICEMVKTQKWYYLRNKRSAYFPINRRLHRVQERERLCPSVKQWKHWNGTISIIQDLHISLSIRDCVFLSMTSSDFWWKGGVDLPNLNSSWLLDVSSGGGVDLSADLGVDLPNLNSSWPLDVSSRG